MLCLRKLLRTLPWLLIRGSTRKPWWSGRYPGHRPLWLDFTFTVLLILIPCVLLLRAKVSAFNRRLDVNNCISTCTWVTIGWDKSFGLWAQDWPLQLLTTKGGFSVLERLCLQLCRVGKFRWCARIILDVIEFFHGRSKIDLDLLLTSVLHASVVAIVDCNVDVLRDSFLCKFRDFTFGFF